MLKSDVDIDSVLSVGPFHHDIELPGGVLTAPETYRMRFFEEAFWPSVLNLTGGTLQGKSVLDVGCNCGGFSFLAKRYGAAKVVGIDVRKSHISQADVLKNALGMSDITFICSDIKSYAEHIDEGYFDVVLLMGVMYHFSDPIGEFEAIARIAKQHIVVDSHVHHSTNPQYEEIPAWTMLCDTDRGEIHDLREEGTLISRSAYLKTESEEQVDYSRQPDAYCPGPHAERNLRIASRFLTNPNAPGPDKETVRSDLKSPFSMVPNKQALVKLVRAFGFFHVTHIEPPRLAEPRYTLRYRMMLTASRGLPS